LPDPARTALPAGRRDGWRCYRGRAVVGLAGRVVIPAGPVWVTSPVGPVPLPVWDGAPVCAAAAGRFPS
jgi:hypothetical protein